VSAALALSAVSKRFGATQALDDVTLSLAPGEVRGLLGPNGAGKTTLLRIVFGVIRPDGGSVQISAAPVAGFVEEPGFYPYLSGRANLELQIELDRGAGARSLQAVLERTGLAQSADRRVGSYSSGMRQRLGLAAALLRGPRLLVLDEPTSALEPAAVRDVLRIIRELAGKGVATLISSHQLDAVEAICDSYTVLDSGRVRWSGSAEQRRRLAPPTNFLLRTSDDQRAAVLAAQHRLRVTGAPGTLELEATDAELDAYMLALAQEGISVRRLQPGGL
jgi:ABC-2 type transport system ATP-binding protein